MTSIEDLVEFKGPNGVVFIKHNQKNLAKWPIELDNILYCLHCGSLIQIGCTPHTIPVSYDSISGVYTTVGFVCPIINGLSCAKGYIIEHPDFLSEVNLALVGQLNYDMFGDTTPNRPQIPRAMMDHYVYTPMKNFVRFTAIQ